MARALVVADDLTGAMDSGHEFAARGFESVLELGGENGKIARDVCVVDTDSRSASAEKAARAVETAIEAYPAEVLYKKIDSTLRGNLVPEIDAAIATSGADLIVFAPAFPATGRTTTEGTHLVDGAPVTEAFDGTNGLASANLPTLLTDSTYPIVECSIEELKRGPEAIRELLSGVERPAIVACDASEEDHLDTIARAAAAVDGDVLYVGSAGLARHVRLPESRSTNDEPTGSAPSNSESEKSERAGTEKVLTVAGSANPRTIEQVTALPADWVIGLDAARAVVDPEAAGAAAGSQAIERLSDGKPAVVTSAPDGGAIERARDTGQAAGEREEVGERIERALAAVAETVYAEDPPESLFLTGGASAVRVLRELDARGIHLEGGAIERGVPVGRVVGGRADGVVLVTKAGGFGTERTIANCLARLRQGTIDHE
ncbi:four-carbon acid sugar kinase family protein [Halobacteriales archaeon QS_3_64_16]|nr:MAG: four-carbon acid sugar kinase family protein [Halobacteriales archaeon QS_3_64_16]